MVKPLCCQHMATWNYRFYFFLIYIYIKTLYQILKQTFKFQSTSTGNTLDQNSASLGVKMSNYGKQEAKQLRGWRFAIFMFEMNVFAVFTCTWQNFSRVLVQFICLQKKCGSCKFTVITAFKVSKNLCDQCLEVPPVCGHPPLLRNNYCILTSLLT